MWMYRLECTCFMEGMYTCDGEAGMRTMCVANLRRLLNMHLGMYHISLIRHGDYYMITFMQLLFIQSRSS